MLERAEIKNKISSILDEMKKSGRIEESYCQELDKSFESQDLHIGVVGKMKAGKSSLVNAVIFGGNILPTGVAPVTVTLTEVTYGEQEKVEVTLMSKQDIEDLKNKANYTGTDAMLISKAESAKDTLRSLAPGYETYLGQPVQAISINDLKEYVAADGKFCGLAKSVKIFLNNDSLKGITIIDTPGFNDPIASRGETTKSALGKCHVLLFVHNEDGYDATDVELLTEQVEYSGISELVDIFNKIDMSEKPINEWPEELMYLTKKRDELNMSKESIKELLKDSHAFYISSLMALCGLVTHDKMDEELKYQYSGFEEDFEELCQFSDKKEQQEAFVKYSNVLSIVDEINRLSRDGSIYLIEGPLKTLEGKLKSIKELIQSELEEKEAQLNSLNVSIEANKKNLENFEDFMSAVMSKVKVSSLKNDLKSLIGSSIQRIQNLRKSESNGEFSKERYPEPGFLDTGVTKGNIASYNTFIFCFENKIRDIQNDLKDQLGNICKKEVNALIESLSGSSLVSQEYIKNLKASLVNSLAEVISDIDVIIPSKRIDDIPDGYQEQWDKLRAKYLCDYDDNSIKELFEDIKQICQDLDFVGTAMQELESLKGKITESLNKTPEAKKEEARKIKETLKKLHDEMLGIGSHITEIETLKKRL